MTGSFTEMAAKLREDSPGTTQTQQRAVQADPISYRHIDRMEADRNAWATQAAAMADNIKSSALKRAELNLAIRAGADPWDSLLLATHIIGLMTGDMTTHQIVKEFRHRV